MTSSAKQSFAEKVKQRRAQMLIHSFLYYFLDDPIISDEQWQQWANELRDLQARHNPKIGFYDEAFKDWDGSTGFDLPQDGWVSSTALRIQRLHHEQQRKETICQESV